MTSEATRASGDNPSQNEFALIDRIIARLGDAVAADILVPPGDDSAVWIASAGAVVASIDAITEGTHWRPHLVSMHDVGWRAIATSVSDIAAMGATPQVVLIAAVLGPSLTLEDMDGFIDGGADACRAHGVHVAGGDITRGRATSFAVTALGAARLDRASRPLVMRRDAAHPGDVVAVSGTPGAAAAGLRALERGASGVPADEAIECFLHPRARVSLGLAAVALGVPCAIDISDGLGQDLGHIAERSDVGIEIDLEAIPLSHAAVALFGVEGARELALGGGDDYELIVVARQPVLAALEGVTIIGHVLDQHPGEVIGRRPDGAPYPIPSGWDQLRAQPLSAR